MGVENVCVTAMCCLSYEVSNPNYGKKLEMLKPVYITVKLVACQRTKMENSMDYFDIKMKHNQLLFYVTEDQ
jgi:hypothetical protein